MPREPKDKLGLQWPCGSFGATLESVKVKDKDGKATELDYWKDKGTSFHDISLEVQENVHSPL